MSGLFSPVSSTAVPSFLTPAAASAPSAATLDAMRTGFASTPSIPVEAWASSQNVELLSLQQELQRIQSELDRLLASFAPLVPATTSVIGRTWEALSNLFAPQPAPAPSPSQPSAPSKAGPTKFVISSFNVLSSSAGKGKGYAAGTTRMHSVVDILKANQVSVVGFQEMAADQLAEFKKVAGNEYGVVAGKSGVRNYHDAAIAWRKDTWSLVKSGTFTVPSYAGRASEVPYVRLRNKQTGQEAYFVDAHNPANTRRYHHQDQYRNEAARLEAAFVDRLVKDTGLPVFLMGDMNSVNEAHDIITQGAPLKAANPAGKAGIDWIFGTKDVSFDHFRRERNAQIAKTTDHPVVFSNVRIGGK